MKSNEIENHLTKHLHWMLPNHSIKEAYLYACLPGGKFFRPSLVWSILKDLNPELFSVSKNNSKSNHALLSSSIELHHTYTLLHDDLPCMDDDTIRRGKACTHLQYGEWQALLAGDGLLNISYQLLAKLKHPRAMDVLAFYSWCCGPKGLIQGQVLDLSHEMTNSFKNTLRTHELKTARLIQAAVLSSAALSGPRIDTKLEKNLFRYSRLLGINFQLIDDLSELADKELSKHELDVNPWLKFPAETYTETFSGLRHFAELSRELRLKETNHIISAYYKKMLSIIAPNVTVINQHLDQKIDLAPIIFLLQQFNV